MIRLLLVLALCSVSAFSSADPGLVVGKVTIHVVDIYSPEEAARGVGYRIASRLHIQTRESVVRTFLLFREGDPYDPVRLEETERNLRALSFLKSASVKASFPHDGFVDVDVTVQDAWTTEPGLSFGSRGGRNTFGLDLSEGNFLGTGRAVSLVYKQGTERTTRAILIRDPAVFGPYWSGELSFADNSDGNAQRLTLDRPFYSMLTPWAVEVDAHRFDQTDRIYEASEVRDEFRHEHARFSLMAGKAFNPSNRWAHRVSGGIDFMDDKLGLDPVSSLVSDRSFRYLFVQYDFLENQFRKLNFVNRDLRYEDFNLGTQLSFRLAASPSFLGAPQSSELVSASLSRGIDLGPGSFLLGKTSYQTRIGVTPRNAITNFQASYVRQLPGRALQTLVGNVVYNRGTDLDPEVQFFADGETGLRAYRLQAFEGDGNLILNVEDRFFLGRELFQLISPGAAVFFDTGRTFGGSSRGFKSDFGVGLRIGMSRAPKNMFRIDFAYALDPDPRGEQGFLISFSSSQAF